MEIREAKKSDYEELMQLYNIFVEEDRYSKHDNDSFEKVLNSQGNYLYVAEEKGKLIGFIVFSTRFVVRYPRHIMTLEELFVSEEHRKHGIGRKLVEIMERKAKELACYNIYVESSMKREVAHRFYENLGYDKHGYYFKKNL